MRLPDLWTGLGFALAGALIALRATSFPQTAGAASPRLFPYIIGGAMVLFGVTVAGRAVAARVRGGEVSFLPPGEDWMRDPRRLMRIAMVPLTILLYGLLAPVWGSGIVLIPLVFLGALSWQERPFPAAVSAVLACLAVIAFFARVMHVPLPLSPVLGSWL